MTGNDIRLMRLLPGRQSDELYGEIIRRHLPPSLTDIDQTLPSLTEIQRTLPKHWTCSKTPEGRLLYHVRGGDDDGHYRCRYDHPFPDRLPSDLLMALSLDSGASGLDSTTHDNAQLEEFEARS